MPHKMSGRRSYTEWFDSWPEELRQRCIDEYMPPEPGQPPATLDGLTNEDKAHLCRMHVATMRNTPEHVERIRRSHS